MSFRRPITILRRSIGVMGEDGYYKPGSTSEMTIRASVQPLSTNEYTLVAAEGSRNVQYVKIYTNVPLQTEKEADWEGLQKRTSYYGKTAVGRSFSAMRTKATLLTTIKRSPKR